MNLANIIKDLKLNEETGKPVLIESIEKLKAHSDGTEPLNDEDFEKVITEITKECDKVGWVDGTYMRSLSNPHYSIYSLYRIV